MPSLSDVARELDVSVSLVSKVLNDRLGTTGVRPDLLEKIRTTAAKMGYRKNFSAISLLSRRQNTIAIFVHSHGAQGSGLVEKLLDGISQATSAASQRISLEFFLDADEFRSKSQGLHSGQVDGLIVTGVSHPELYKDFLAIQKTEVPIVTVYNEPIHKNLVNIGVHHADLSDAATTHLIERGCRRILHLSVLEAREEGYRRALRRAGIPVRRELIQKLTAPEGFRSASARESMRAVIAKGIAFDGLSAQSDTQAAAAINELVLQGIRVPEEVKVAGIDNAPFTDFYVVPITSVSQLFVERGRRAVSLLNRLVQGESAGSISLKPDLRIRASSGG